VECYQLHYPRLIRALCLAGAPYPVAEDLAEEAFARMFTHWRRVRRGTNPAGYAYRTGFRLLNRSRRVRDGTADAAQLLPDTVGPEGLVTTRLMVAATLAAMPRRRRECAVMCLVVGLSTRATASALGIAEGTVRKHVGQARDDLRQTLA